MSRDSKHGDMGVNWDADALRAANAPYPYTTGTSLQYFKDLVEHNDRVLEVGCQIASWIWAWRDIEPTIRYEGVDWSAFAIKIARERYGKDGKHDISSMKEAWVKWWLHEGHLIPYPPAKFHCMDARDMDFHEEFDIVFTHTFYQHTNLETKKAVVPRVYEALKPGGFHIIQENTSYDSSGTWFKEGWIRFFESYGFKVIRTHDIGGGGTGFVFQK